MRYRFHRLSWILLSASLLWVGFGMLLAGAGIEGQNTPGQSTLLKKATTLKIRNDSTRTICKVFIIEATESGWGDNWLNGDTIASNETRAFNLSQGQYHIFLTGCDDEWLFLKRNQHVGSRSVLNIRDIDRCETYYEEGLRLYRNNQYAESLQVSERALACYQEIGERGAEGAAATLIGHVYLAQELYEDALVYYEQALTIYREMKYRAGEGTALMSLAAAYSRQGHHGLALEMYEQALAIYREIEDRANQATVLFSIGLMHEYQTHNQLAIESYAQARTAYHEIGDRSGEALALRALGNVSTILGRYTEAIDYLEHAVTIYREIEDPFYEAVSLNNLGLVFDRQGRYEEALVKYDQALVLHRTLGEREEESTVLNNIGLVYHNQGRFEEAIRVYQQALAIERQVGDRGGEGTTLGNIGGSYDSLGRYEEALNHHQQALVIQRDLDDRSGEASTLNNIGLVYDHQGKYAEALEYYRLALALAQEIGERAGEGTTLHNIAGIYAMQGKYAEALETYRQALSVRDEVGDQAGVGLTRFEMGDVYHAQGRNNLALVQYRQAMDILETVRAGAGGDTARASFIAQYAALYDRAIEVYFEEGQFNYAFLTTERGRARAFLDALASGQIVLSDHGATQLLKAEQEAYTRRLAAQEALARARSASEPGPQEQIVELEKQLTTAQAEYDAAVAAVEARGDQLAELLPGRRTVPTPSKLQALLDEQTTLISYWVLDNMVFAFLVTRDSLQVVKIPIRRQEISEAIQSLRAFTNTNVSHPADAVHLYTWLFAPLREHLTTPHLLIVPHDVLHYLPFAALTDGKHYLIDDYSLALLPSASSLRFIRDNVRPSPQITSPLILGNPTVTYTDLAPLGSARREAQQIANLFDSQPLLDAAATELALREQAAVADLVHLSAHGTFSLTNPLQSAIFLAQDTTQQYDGRLEVQEVYALDLHQSQLVVLSACETQVSDSDLTALAVTPGDELVSLTRAFFFAGTPSVVATLWLVESDATQFLMEEFYRYLSAGLDKAEALRQAQLAVRAVPHYQNPYFWSGFVLSGDRGPIIGNGGQ